MNNPNSRLMIFLLAMLRADFCSTMPMSVSAAALPRGRM